MDLKALFDDEGAVSPVIGVILMVAITVILAAVIASFVLGLGDNLGNQAPQASFSFDYENNTNGKDVLEVTHDGGATVDPDRVNATVSGALDGSDGALTFGNSQSNGNDGGDLFNSTNMSEVNAGTTSTISAHDFNSIPSKLNLAESTVRVVYVADSGSQSATLAEWSGPDA